MCICTCVRTCLVSLECHGNKSGEQKYKLPKQYSGIVQTLDMERGDKNACASLLKGSLT